MREAFLEALRGRVTDEVSWAADLAYWIEGQIQAGMGAVAWRTEKGYLELCREVGTMPYYWYGRFSCAEPRFKQVKVSVERRGGTTVTRWRTPRGALEQHTTFSPESSSEAITKYPVEDRADLEALLALLRDRTWVPRLDDYPQRLAFWAGYDGIPGLGLPRSPMSAFITEFTGVQNGVYLLFDYPALVTEALAIMEAAEAPVVDAVCRTAPPLIHFPDNLTREVYTGLFEPHMRDRYRRRLARLHDAGVLCAVHLDGTVRGLLPKLGDVGFDSIEALTPKPVGDVGLAEMRTLSGRPAVALWGGLPGALFAPPHGKKAILEQLDILLHCWRGTPFIVGVADQVPPDGSLEAVKAVGRSLRECTG